MASVSEAVQSVIQPSPLELFDYWVMGFKFEAHAEPVENRLQHIPWDDPDLDVSARVERLAQDHTFWSHPGDSDSSIRSRTEPRPEEGDWLCNLNIVLENESAPHNYTIDLWLWGFFRISSNFPVQSAEQLVRINGPALLYSVARDMVTTATSRGPYAPLLLPTVTFGEPPKSIKPKKPAGVGRKTAQGS